MNEPVFFSIVVPTYNRAHLISATVESVLNQTYKNFELLVIDDGSTDDTESVMQKYISDKVRYFKKENGERGSCRNYGTALAKGDYINWFDSDDIMLPNHLEVASGLVTRFQRAELFSTGFRYQDGDGNLISTSNYPTDINKELYKGNAIVIDCLFVRRDVALELPFNEDRALSASEDYELWLRMGAKYKFHTVPDITVAVIYHLERSVIAMTNPNQLIARYTRFIQYSTADPSVAAFLGSNKDAFVMKNYLYLAVALAHHHHLDQAKKYLKMAISSSPRIFLEKGFYAFLKHYLRHSLSQ